MSASYGQVAHGDPTTESQRLVFDEIAGSAELVELGARRSGDKAPDIAEKAAFFGELLWIVRDRGYSSGWGFGVWPNDPRIRCTTASPPSLKTKNWIVSRQIAFAKGRRA